MKQSNTAEIYSDYDPSLYTDNGEKEKEENEDGFYKLNTAQENEIDSSLRRLYALEKYLLDDPEGEVNEENYENSEDDDEQSDEVDDEKSNSNGTVSDQENNNSENDNDGYQELFFDKYFNKFFNPESGKYHDL